MRAGARALCRRGGDCPLRGGFRGSAWAASARGAAPGRLGSATELPCRGRGAPRALGPSCEPLASLAKLPAFEASDPSPAQWLMAQWLRRLSGSGGAMALRRGGSTARGGSGGSLFQPHRGALLSSVGGAAGVLRWLVSVVQRGALNGVPLPFTAFLSPAGVWRAAEICNAFLVYFLFFRRKILYPEVNKR